MKVKEFFTHGKRWEKKCLHKHVKTDDIRLCQELIAYENGYLPSKAKKGTVFIFITFSHLE